VRRRALAAAVAGVLVAIGAPANAFARAKTFAGVVPDVPTGGHVERRALAHAANLPYLGGPVMHSNRTHLIFWQPAGSGLSFDPGYTALVQRFEADVAADSHHTTNVYSLSGQYSDGDGIAGYSSTYAGAVLDTDPLPLNGCVEPPLGVGPGWGYCVSDQQIENEITRVVRANTLPVTNRDIYFLVTPNGLGSCESTGPRNCALGGPVSGYCGYHSTTPDLLLYAVIPYNAVPGHCQSGNPRPNASAADPTISTVSHEHNETVTDPFGTAWIDSSAAEEADLCITSFGPTLGPPGLHAYNEVIHGDRYELQEEWSNHDHGCRQRARRDKVTIRSLRRATAGQDVTFSARASDPQGSIGWFQWSFGPDARARGRRAAHAFGRPGSYRVTLRTTDSWGNWAFAARRVAIAAR
jgi:hypothetical protein